MLTPSTRSISSLFKRPVWTFCMVLPALLVPVLHAQKPASEAADPMSTSARQWATEASQNELKVLEYTGQFLRYRIHVRDSKGDQIRDVIESKDGAVARLIFKEGRPLTSEEDSDERTRLQAMLDSPAAFSRHIKDESRGKKMAGEIIHTLPDAMLYSFVPGQPQRQGANRRELVIDFEPNPQWSPPTMISEGLTGLKGRAWIDPQTHCMTRLEGNIYKGVNVGMGMFAHIYPGGSLAFDQIQLANGRWIFSRFSQHLTVRALMVKTIKENMEIEGANYAEVGPMPYTEAVKLLLASPLPQTQP